jgi:hypothetical protein
MIFNKFYFIFIIFLFSLSLSSLAQNKHKKEIDEVIKNYFEGYLEGNIQKLAVAFDTLSGSMIAKVKDSTTNTYKFNALLKRWVENTTKKPFSKDEIKKSYYKILSMDMVDEKMAIIKIEILLGKNLFIDALSLYKINQQWKIVSKVFVKKN